MDPKDQRAFHRRQEVGVGGGMGNMSSDTQGLQQRPKQEENRVVTVASILTTDFGGAPRDPTMTLSSVGVVLSPGAMHSSHPRLG